MEESALEFIGKFNEERGIERERMAFGTAQRDSFFSLHTLIFVTKAFFS